MSMEVLLRRLAEEERKKPKPLPEAIVMELRKAAKRYGRTNPFQIDDLVTLAPNSIYKHKGEPHLVLDRQTPAYSFHGQAGGHLHGLRIDMRVLILDGDGELNPYWVEGAQFDPWADPSAKTAPPVPVASEDEAFRMEADSEMLPKVAS